MNFRKLRVCFVLVGVMTSFRMARGQAYPTVGTIGVGYGVPSTNDVDNFSHDDPFTLNGFGGGAGLGDGMGNEANIYTGLNESPSETALHALMDLSRLGVVVGTRSYGYVTQFIDVNDPVTYTLSGTLNFTSPGVNFSTDLVGDGTGTIAPFFSEQYVLSNVNGDHGGTVTIGPVSGELLAGEHIQWDWSVMTIADAIADGGNSLTGNLDLTFTTVPEPTLGGGLVCGLLLMRRRR